jgi:hypothetical protein
VQRPADPSIYSSRGHGAGALLRQLLQGGRSGQESASRSRLTPSAAQGQGGPLQGLLAPENPGTGVAGLLAALKVENPPVPQTGPTLPAFNARRFLAMPQGYQPSATQAPVSDKPSLSDLIGLTQGLGGQDSLPVSSAPQGGPAPPVMPRAGRGGSIRLARGADRAGVGTSSAVKRFVRSISALYGQPLTIGTGTNHSRLTVDGNVSDHWSGNAADIPASGKALTRLGQEALIAAGMPEKQARKQTGGLFNVNGHQIIFNSNIGGNHYNHLHVSAH